MGGHAACMGEEKGIRILLGKHGRRRYFEDLDIDGDYIKMGLKEM